MSIPLAWLQLIHQKTRLLVAIAGIGFAVILIFFQLGMKEALFTSAIRLHQALDGDIFLVSPQSTALIAMKSFSRRRIYQAEAAPGVETISPIYLDFGIWKNPTNRSTRGILVIGYDPDRPIFGTSMITPEQQQRVKMPDVVLFDRKSRAEFGDIEKLLATGKPVETEVRSRRITVQGLFDLGASFGADGNLITSDLNFQRIFKRDPGLIDVGLIRLKPGADIATAIQYLRTNLQEKTGDIKIFSKEEFIEFERGYWQSSTAIGVIFTFGAIVSWIVGVVIVYQILYTDVADHLPEYATLKAMGYKGSYLLSVVFQEAVILSILGFIPAFGLACLVYNGLSGATSLPVTMTQQRGLFVLASTFIMCVASGAVAVLKVQDADPADIF
jgi:putative ABC transport system permease protein